MPRNVRTALAAVPFLLVVACTDPAKAPAEAAIAAATSAVESMKGEVALYAPDALQATKAALANARDLFAKSDFQGALKVASGIPEAVKGAFATAAARKAQIEAAMAGIAKDAAQAFADLRKRIDELSSARKLPRGVDRQAIDAAREVLASTEAQWKQASAMATHGDFQMAISEGMRLKLKAQDALRSLAGK